MLAPAQVAAGLGLEAGSYSPAMIHRAENTDDVDRLRDNHGHPVTVHTVTATGQAPTVHNIEVNNTHTYHTTTTTGTHILAHNGCTVENPRDLATHRHRPGHVARPQRGTAT